jgi:hypothetical protein
LRLLLLHALIALGGDFSLAPEPLQLPLTAAAIARIDREERRAVNRASFVIWAFIVSALLITVSTVAAVVWAAYVVMSGA